jgi:hypothetical protein
LKVKRIQIVGGAFQSESLKHVLPAAFSQRSSRVAIAQQSGNATRQVLRIRGIYQDAGFTVLHGID